MEPCSVLELTSTVIKIAGCVYNFLQAVHNAPEDLCEYIEVLENIRKVFADVEKYVALHEKSHFEHIKRTQLDTITAVLQDCKITFTSQLSSVEDYDAGDATSKFKRLRKSVEFAFGKGVLKQNTAKLQASQNLLLQAVSTSVGNNTVLLREEVGSMRSGIEEAVSAFRDEQQLHQRYLLQYERLHEAVTTAMLDIAKANAIRSETRLEDLTTAVTANQSGFNLDVGQEISTNATRPGHGASGSAPAPQNTSKHVSSTEVVQPPLIQGSESTYADMLTETLLSINETLPPEQLSILSEVHSSDELMQAVQQGQYYKPASGSRLPKMVSALSQFASVVDVFVQGRPEFAALIWGSIRYLIEVGQIVYGDFSVGLEEMADAMTMCSRELRLYQQRDMGLWMIAETERHTLNRNIAEIRRISERVVREVDYQHRVEMRQAGSMIADMHVKQYKIVQMLHDQKAILESMQQERKLMDLVREQQKILQIVRRIQNDLRLQTRP
ncbi:hypothetical protein BGZ63DRAFT_420636 [Mariannaea sp. PMI_226]|nr:hypothetical protein BGZ63DRAFT_420636 [Mariannaea sp. PMI_226]